MLGKLLPELLENRPKMARIPRANTGKPVLSYFPCTGESIQHNYHKAIEIKYLRPESIDRGKAVKLYS